MLLQQQTNLLLGTGELLCPEAALGQHLVQFSVVGIGIRNRFEIFRGEVELLGPVVAHAQQSPNLNTGGIGLERRAQRGGRCRKMPLLEFGQAQIQLQPRKLGIELQSFTVSRDGFNVFLLARQIKPEAGESCSIVGIALGELLPDLGGFTPLLLLLEREGVRSARHLRQCERAAK